MRTVACGEPLSLSHVPSDRVIRIAGPSAEQLVIVLDPLPDGAPVVIRYRVPASPVTALAVVDDALAKLEIVARELFPAWLLGADAIATSSDFDRRVVRELARRMASTTEHFGPFLADVAEAALSGRDVARRYEPETRARGLARIIGDAYDRASVVLLVAPADGLDETEQQGVAAACQWLAAHGAFGVWLTGDALPAIDRFPTWQLALPSFVEQLTASNPAQILPAIDYPPVAGRPHPASIAEQTLERCLAACDWAVGRTWNQVHASHSLVPPIRVDLMWPDERCVVELDGPDHRGVLKYADDRRRDNGLVLDGFAVLRFTNDEVTDDPQRVLGTIERLLAKKRSDGGKVL